MNNVKELRRKAGIQQKELSIIIGVAQPTVSDWESNKKDPSGERLKKLSDYFGVSKSEILCNKEESPPELDGDVQEMLIQFQRLPLPDRQRVLGFVEGLLSSRGQ